MTQTIRIPKPKTPRVPVAAPDPAAQTAANALVTTMAASFESFAEVATCQVQRQPIHEFLQGIPHRWVPEDIDRFGYRVGRMALAFGLPIVNGYNAELGEIRIYPVSFLEWVYSTLAGAAGNKWPLLTDAQMLEDGRRAQRIELRKRERAVQSLQDISETADNVEVLTAIRIVRDSIEQDIARLRAEPAVTASV